MSSLVATLFKDLSSTWKREETYKLYIACSVSLYIKNENMNVFQIMRSPVNRTFFAGQKYVNNMF